MKRRFATAVVTAALLAACAATTTPRSAAEPISADQGFAAPEETATQMPEAAEAMGSFKMRDYQSALRLWKEAAKKEANLPPAQTIMAQLYFQVEMLKEGQEALQQAVVDDPNDPEAYLLMAGIAMQERDLAKAESLCQKASGLLSAFNKSAKRKAALQLLTCDGLARVAEARQDWAAAQKTLEEWSKLDPKNTSAIKRIAICLLNQKDVDGALQRLRDAVKAGHAMLTPEALLAQFYQQSGDRENAGKWMAAALTAAPKDVKTRLAVGQCALEIGQMDEAQKQAVAAMQIDPKSVEAEFFRGLVALCQKDYRTAESYFDSVLKRSPSSYAISNNLALALIEQEDEAKGRRALEYAEANARNSPKSANAASTYGWVLYRLGRLDDAEKALGAAASLGNMSIDTAYYTARVAVDRGRKDEARRLLETALKNTERAMFRQDAENLLEELKKGA